MKLSKVAIIGAGRVGTTTAFALMLKNIAGEILLVDVDKLRCKGELLDLSDVLPFSATSSLKDASLSQAARADIIIITAGAAQKPGQPRLELLDINKIVMDDICAGLRPLNPKAIIIVATNPVDILTQYLQSKINVPYNQIFGSGTFLDSQRLLVLLATKLNVSPTSIHALVLGEHGESQFTAWSSAMCDGKPIATFENIDSKKLNLLEQQVKQKAADIISCKGSTYYGIAACLVHICETIIFNQKKIVPVSCYVETLKLYISLPCVIGANGIEKIITISLSKKEKEQLEESAQILRTISQNK